MRQHFIMVAFISSVSSLFVFQNCSKKNLSTEKSSATSSASSNGFNCSEGENCSEVPDSQSNRDQQNTDNNHLSSPSEQPQNDLISEQVTNNPPIQNCQDLKISTTVDYSWECTLFEPEVDLGIIPNEFSNENYKVIITTKTTESDLSFARPDYLRSSQIKITLSQFKSFKTVISDPLLRYGLVSPEPNKYFFLSAEIINNSSNEVSLEILKKVKIVP